LCKTVSRLCVKKQGLLIEKKSAPRKSRVVFTEEGTVGHVQGNAGRPKTKEKQRRIEGKNALNLPQS